MVDTYVDDQQVIEVINHRLGEMCRITNVSIYKLVENDNRLTYKLVDLLTGRNMFLNIDKQLLAGTTELRKTEVIYSWIIKYIKLLVNKRYGAEKRDE